MKDALSLDKLDFIGAYLPIDLPASGHECPNFELFNTSSREC